MARQGEGRQSKPKAAKAEEAIFAGALAAGVDQGPKKNGSKEPSELHEFLFALQAMRSGDFSVRMSGDHEGIFGKIADTFNDIVAASQRMSKELDRVGEVVGREGKTRHRVKFGLASGAWSEMETSVNTLIEDLLWPTKEVTRAVAAAAGRLAQDRAHRGGRPPAQG